MPEREQWLVEFRVEVIASQTTLSLPESHHNYLWDDVFETVTFHLTQDLLDFLFSGVHGGLVLDRRLIHDLSFRGEFAVLVDMHELLLVVGVEVDSVLVLIIHMK